MKFYPLAVRDVIDETPAARSFVLEPAAEYRELFRYKPGQFLTFRVPGNGAGFLERCYSLSSAPETDSHLKITVKREPGGHVSNWLNDFAKTGDSLEAAPPGGRFTLGAQDRPLALFAAGSGITPVISIIKSALRSRTCPVRLIYANRDRNSVIFHREIADLCEEHRDRLRCHHHLDTESGFLTADIVKTMCGDADHYVCGPEPFMDVVEDALSDAGVDANKVFVERFTALDNPEVTTVMTTPSDVTGFRATLDGVVHDVAYQSGMTLLECLLSANLDPAYSCQDGRCGSCMAISKGGAVNMRKNNVLSKRDLDRGYVLLCQSEPTSGDVWVDCDE